MLALSQTTMILRSLSYSLRIPIRKSRKSSASTALLWMEKSKFSAIVDGYLHDCSTISSTAVYQQHRGFATVSPTSDPVRILLESRLVLPQDDGFFSSRSLDQCWISRIQPLLDFCFVLLNGALYRTLITEADTVEPATQCGFGNLNAKLSLNQHTDGR